MVVHVLPSSISTRTSTSVIVSLKTAELDSLAGQPIRSGVDPSPFEERIRQFLLDRLFEVLHIARHG